MVRDEPPGKVIPGAANSLAPFAVAAPVPLSVIASLSSKGPPTTSRSQSVPVVPSLITRTMVAVAPEVPPVTVRPSANAPVSASKSKVVMPPATMG